MDNRLEKDHYLVIRNFINPDRARALHREFVLHCDENDNINDDQVFSSQVEYNYISFLELLNEKSTFVGNQIREVVLPTYCYARHYMNDALLVGHTDRPSCEVSVTLHLDGDRDWPFYIMDSDKKTHELNLKSGDAAIYLGMRGKHWRKSYRGESYSQVFLHYVRSRGEHAKHYFDKKK